MPPEDILAVEGELVTFTCEAIGQPPPNITLNVSPSRPPSATMSSTLTGTSLQLEAALSVNGSTVQCVAENSVGVATSDIVTLTIAGKGHTKQANTLAH